MNIEVYIPTRSLMNIRGVTSKYLINRLLKLIKDIKCLRAFVKDSSINLGFYASKRLLTRPILGDQDIFTFINNNIHNPEDVAYFYLEFEKESSVADHSNDVIEKFCKNNTLENVCKTFWNPMKRTSTRVINNYIDFDNYEIIGDGEIDGLFLMRQVLGNYPETSDVFITRCRKLFENIIFHDNCIASLNDGEEYLKIVPRKIVYCLSCLNDLFVTYADQRKGKSKNTILKNFAGDCGLDNTGSLDVSSKKEKLLFAFPKEGEKDPRSVYCNPHLKMIGPDNNYRGEGKDGLQSRIYFNYDDGNFDHNIILVGSMGVHL